MLNIVSWSGGKDSTATIILAKEKGIPINHILFSEVMFDANISCELPEHMKFVKEVAIPLFEGWGYRTKILRYKKSYMDYFNQIRKRGKHIGKKVGFPMADKCNVRNCKVEPIRNFLKEHKNAVQFVGICADEPARLNRLSGGKKSLLAEYGYTGEMAKKKCQEYGLLSPYYRHSRRGGCWCCPNAGKEQMEYIRNEHGMLWNRLIALEQEDNLIGNIFNTRIGRSIVQMEEEFLWKDRQMTIFDI